MKNSNLKSQSGISIIEVLMGTMVLAIFIMGLTSLLTFTADQNKQIMNKVDQEIDTIIGERFLFTDLRNATPSLNNINTQDDNGREFFDYIPDVSPNLFASGTTRTLTLSGSLQRELIVMAIDLSDAPTMIYDPTAAYNIAVPPADLNTPGILTFVSLNRNNYVNNAQRTVMKNNGNFWRDGQIMLLDTPARIRPVPANGTMNMSIPPRSSIFLGRVSGAQMLPINVPQIKRAHPGSATGIQVTTPDYFLRTVPPINGSAPVVRMANVKVIRYSTGPTQGKPGKITVYREIHNGTSFTSRQAIAAGLQQLVFTRESIFHPMISFKLVYDLPRTQ